MSAGAGDLERPAGAVHLTRGGERDLAAGNPTVPERAVARVEGELAPGAAVRAFDARGDLVGVGYWNPGSRLPLRILRRDDGPLDAELWRGRLAVALAWRERHLGARRCIRWVYGEADDLPGLVVDRYEQYLVVQASTLGMELRLPAILPVLTELAVESAGGAPVAAVVLRGDSPGRKREGLASERRVAAGELPRPVWVELDGLALAADLLEGHKTGMFLDQAANRARAAAACAGKRVLDAFCYAGDFALRAALAGAARVTAIDLFQRGLDLAALALARCGAAAGRVELVRADVFDFLRAPGEPYDVLFVDPPSLVHGAREAHRQAAVYRRLVELAARRTAAGGLLVVSSCSYHLSRAAFLQEIAQGLRRAGRTGRIVELAGAAPDHPIHPALPETDYLKCAFLALE